MKLLSMKLVKFTEYEVTEYDALLSMIVPCFTGQQ